jgi:hypothetical protein
MKIDVDMKTILIIAITILATKPALTQANKVAFDKRIIIPAREVRIGSLLKIFSAQTGVEFSFNSSKISSSKKLTVPKQSVTLSQWLDIIDQTVGAQHKVVGNHIILVTANNVNITRQSINVPKQQLLKGYNKSNNAITKSNIKKTNRNNRQTVVKNFGPTNKSNSSYETITTSALNNNFYLNSLPVSDTLKMKEKSMELRLAETSADSSNSNAITATIVDSVNTSKPALPSINTQSKGSLAKKSNHAHNDESNTAAPVLPLSTIDVGPEGLAVSFDFKLSNKMLLDWSIGLGGGYAIRDSSFKYKMNLRLPELYSSITARYYYNRAKREAKGKSILNNSGDFVGLKVKYVSDRLTENFSVWDALLINIHWGMQRSISPHILFNGHVGGGYGTATYFKSFPTYHRFYPAVNFTLSYRISRLRMN